MPEEGQMGMNESSTKGKENQPKPNKAAQKAKMPVVNEDALLKEEEKSDNEPFVKIAASNYVNQKDIKVLQEEYDELEELGEGAFGKVKKVVHKPSGQIRALKIIKRASFKRSGNEEILKREIEVLKKLKNPYILEIFEFFQDSKNYYIVSEYCNGGELFDMIVQMKSFSERKAATMLKQILTAVSYCHSMKIVHRDLKPDNILLELNNKNKEEFTLKIIDFGTSTVYKPNQNLKEKTGTPYYIAPEVIHKRYDEKCDIWSCGVILFILLLGFPPFNGRNPDEIMDNVKTGDYSKKEMRSLSLEAQDLIKKMLCYQKEDRLSAQECLEHPWIKQNAPNQVLEGDKGHKILRHLKTFNASKKLEEATLSYIINFLVDKDEMNELKSIFIRLDQNNDGTLTKDEIKSGYAEIFGQGSLAQVDKIFENVDKDGNNSISYEEFILAAMNKKKVLTDKKLEKAFKMFDKNGDGFIEASEIKAVLGKDESVQDKQWQRIINEFDMNGDGKVNYEEFAEMMTKSLKK